MCMFMFNELKQVIALLGCIYTCGEWDISILEVQLQFLYLFTVDCGPPGTPQRGSMNYTTTAEGSVAFYSCNQHLVPEGWMRANCTRNGWSPLDPGRVNCTEGILTGELLS